jgi:hypothetical protein
MDAELDGDCWFMVLQHLALDEIYRVRRVSTLFSQVASSNALWEPILKSFAGIDNQQCDNCFIEFQNIIRKLPYVISENHYAKIAKQASITLEKNVPNKITYTYLRIEDNEDLGEDTFKMAAILSVLNENGHIPRLNDNIRFKSTAYASKQAQEIRPPLYELCYCMCNGMLEEFCNKHGVDDYENYKISIQPNVDSKQEFVRLDLVPDPVLQQISQGIREYTHGQTEAYFLPASKRLSNYYNWAPIYYNAGGQWVDVTYFWTWYEPGTKCILVLKQQTEEFEY